MMCVPMCHGERSEPPGWWAVRNMSIQRTALPPRSLATLGMTL